MSSWVFEIYIQGNNYAEYRWDKCGGYVAMAGHKENSVVVIDYKHTYCSVQEARRSYLRQVKRLKQEGGE